MTTYPLMETAAETLRTASGRRLDEITPAAVSAGQVSIEDLCIHAATLHAQADIARQAGYGQLAANLTRAAELTGVPNPELLQMYESLRPGRASYNELMTLADRLEGQYAAPTNAALVREAALIYQARGLLRRPD